MAQTKYTHFILSGLWSVDLTSRTLCHYTGLVCVRVSPGKPQRQTDTCLALCTHRTPIRNKHTLGLWCSCAETCRQHQGSRHPRVSTHCSFVWEVPFSRGSELWYWPQRHASMAKNIRRDKYLEFLISWPPKQCFTTSHSVILYLINEFYFSLVT